MSRPFILDHRLPIEENPTSVTGSMPLSDPRTRSKISFAPASQTSNARQRIPFVLTSHLVQAVALYLTKAWLLDRNTSPVWVATSTLQVAGLALLLWSVSWRGRLKWPEWSTREWSDVGLASAILLTKQLALVAALLRLPADRVVLFTQTSTLWYTSLSSPKSFLSGIAILSAFAISVLADISQAQSLPSLLIGYAAILLYSLASNQLQNKERVLRLVHHEVTSTPFTVLGAAVLSFLPQIFDAKVIFPGEPGLPLASYGLTIPLLAISAIFLLPETDKIVAPGNHTYPLIPPIHSTNLIFGCTGILSFWFAKWGSTKRGTWSVTLSTAVLYYGCITSVSSHQSGVSTRSSTMRLLHTYLKAIMENPDSRKIFYFLLINLMYMVVQMLWGFWTNSLGLVSDAIHMLFDCFSVGVGLMASVMASWPPNERFTYGYGRIETLSGFANGIFLILISVFIVCEAVQRIVEPPEMGNFKQLLLVSTIGLGVNLFGMFALGGHHHHGHSHSHSHSHAPVQEQPQPPPAHSHSHSRPHTDSGSHSHSHSPKAQAHSHSHSQPHSHSHSHSHSHEQNHSHSHSHDEPHPEEKHDHGGHHHSHDHGDSCSDHGSDLPPIDAHRHSHGSPQIGDIMSPITPSYPFDHDPHLELHHPGHGHSHHDDHHGHGHNMRGVFLHVMADTLGSVGVIISTLLIEYYGWTGFDPIASLFIAALIAASVVPLVMDCAKVLCLDIGDKEHAVEDALRELSDIAGVSSYSEPRFWPKDATTIVGSIHIKLAHSQSSRDPTGPHSSRKAVYVDVERVIQRVDRHLRARIAGLEDLAIQVEGES